MSSVIYATPSASLTVPGIPTGLTATPGDSQVALSWTAPTSNGGAAIDYYLVYVNGAVDPGHYPTTSATMTGMINGQSYSFTVAAHSSAGIGLQSTAVTAVPSSVKTVPGAPTSVVATPGNGKVSLAWTAPSNNGGVAIDYYLVYMNGAARSDHYSAASAIITGLTNGQVYSFAVVAHNSVGASLSSSSISASPSTLKTVPVAPLELNATPGNNQIILSWMSPSNDGGATIDYFIVYQDGADVAHPTTTSSTITGLSNVQQYSFTVAAHNSVGIGAQSTPVLSTPSSGVSPPGTPTDLTATAGAGTVKLSWVAPSGSTIDYYIVYQNGVPVDNTSATSATISGLTNGQNYSFAVAAHNSGGVDPCPRSRQFHPARQAPTMVHRSSP